MFKVVKNKEMDMFKAVKNRHVSSYLEFLLLYFVFALMFYLSFLVYGKAFLWGADGLSQTYPGLMYFKEWFSDIFTSIFVNHSFEVEMWKLSLGFGQDVFGNAIDLRIPNILFAIFPDMQVELFLETYVNVSMILAGETFIKFAKNKSNSKIGVVIGALIYVFSGYTLYFSVKHTFFLEMMILFPLLLNGVDIIFEKKISYLFIFTVFLSGLSYFYFLYMITIPTVIYAFFKFFEQETHGIHAFIKTIGMFLWQYVLGLLLAAISLVPSLVRVLQSGREHSAQGNRILFWEKEYYLELIKGIFDINTVPNVGCITIAGLGIIAFIYLIFCGKRWRKSILLQIAIYVVALLLPPLSLLFCAYTGRAQRWSFVLTFWMAMAFVMVFPEMLDRNSQIYKKVLMLSGGGVCLYIIIALLTEGRVRVNIIWIFIYLAILAVHNFTTFFKNHERRMIILFIICMVIEVGVKAFCLYSPRGENYVGEFADAGKVVERGNDNASFMVNSLDDEAVYRSDIVIAPLDEKYNQNNYGLRNNVNGLASYYSFTNGRISQYSIDMGNSQQNVRFLILDLNQRTALNELAAVKYLATTESGNFRIPYGYDLIEVGSKLFSDGREENCYLYENKYSLPMMYVYDSWIDKNSYNELEVNEKEQAMLQGIVLEEDINYPKTDLKFDYEILMKWEDISAYIKDTQIDNNTFEITEDGIIVKDSTCLSVPIPKMVGEIYVRIKDAEYISKNINEEKEWKALDGALIRIVMGNTNNECTLTNSTYEYYMGKRDFLLNLGYRETESEMNLIFSAEGEYQFSDIEILCQPMNQYPSQIEKLTNTPVTDITLCTNGITGKMKASEEKMLCVAVPYSEGWRAFINGEETKIYPANGMYMAIKVPSGENEIYFQYHTEGLLIGTLISCGTFLIFVVILSINGIAKIRKKRVEK